MITKKRGLRVRKKNIAHHYSKRNPRHATREGRQQGLKRNACPRPEVDKASGSKKGAIPVAAKVAYGKRARKKEFRGLFTRGRKKAGGARGKGELPESARRCIDQSQRACERENENQFASRGANRKKRYGQP